MTTKTTKKAETAWGEIVDAANAEAQQSCRVVNQIAVGKCVRQGDVYLVAVEPAHPHGEETTNRQLAVGETQGSRHILEGEATLYVGTDLPPGWAQWGGAKLLGPMIVALQRFNVTHPEHAHVSLPAGCYQVVLQLDASTMRAVHD